MEKLYKTSIVIWSDKDPTNIPLDELTWEAMKGDFYCSKREISLVENPQKDIDYDENMDCFFQVKEDEKEEKEEMEYKFLNYYKCSECGTEWEDEWECTCNDKCPNCDTEIDPYKSKDLE